MKEMKRIDGDGDGENPLHTADTLHGVGINSKLDNPPAECNEGISNELWSTLSLETRKSIYTKCVEDSMVYGSKPDGISSRIWNMISDNDKADVLLNTNMVSGIIHIF